jgi:glutamate synthase domain-containing protein 2
VSMRQVQVGKAMVSPMRAFDAMGFEEAKQKLDKLHQEMDEACDRLFEAHH